MGSIEMKSILELIFLVTYLCEISSAKQTTIEGETEQVEKELMDILTNDETTKEQDNDDEFEIDLNAEKGLANDPLLFPSPPPSGRRRAPQYDPLLFPSPPPSGRRRAPQNKK